MKSTARVGVFPDDINGQVSLDQGQFESLGHRLWLDLEMDAQDTLRMTDYISGFQPRYVDGSGEVLSCTATLRLQLII